MRKAIAILIAAVMVFAMAYEIAFRCITADCGLVDVRARPPRVYYGRDGVSFPWRRMIFAVRTRLPLGKVRLAPDHLYVDGGRVYCRAPDGEWLDMDPATNEKTTKP